MSGDGIISGLIIGIATFTLLWVIGVVLKSFKPRRNGLMFLLVFSVVLLAPVKWFVF